MAMKRGKESDSVLPSLPDTDAQLCQGTDSVAPTVRRICVVGLGHIGLPTAVVLAGLEHRVVGVDVDERIVNGVNHGSLRFVEGDIQIALRHVVKKGLFFAAREPEPADVFLIAVPTPCTDEHKADLSFVRAAFLSIAPHLRSGNLVLLESTCPVGTTLEMSRLLAELRPDLNLPSDVNPAADIHVAFCPERILPGNTFHELIHNDRIIGGLTRRCSELAGAFYESFVYGRCLITDARTAEMAKLAENAFRDVNIAFANELSILCDKMNVDVWELIELANCHPRVNILNPGPGVGGHCVAVDPWFLVQAGPEETKLIQAARAVNVAKPAHVVKQVIAAASSKDNPTIACLGLTFKAAVSDLRQSPAIEIVAALADAGIGRVVAVDPYVQQLPPELSTRNVELLSLDTATRDADLLVLLVDHAPFRGISAELLRSKNVIDTRGMWRASGPAEVPPLTQWTDGMRRAG